MRTSTIKMSVILLAAFAACGETVTTSTSAGTGGGAPACVVGQDQTCNDDPSVSALSGHCQADGTCACNLGFEPSPNTGLCKPIADGGQATCGDHTCKADEFCVKRVHSQDGGPVPPTWECQLFWQCDEHTCTCALMSFVSASCISPMCTSESPIVMIQCDDLN